MADKKISEFTVVTDLEDTDHLTGVDNSAVDAEKNVIITVANFVANVLGLGTAATKDVGTTAGTVAAGDDSRLSNARTPTAHASTHKSGGADAIKLDELAAPDDNTTLNATELAHGLLPKLSGDATEYLNGEGAYTTPPEGDVVGPSSAPNNALARYDGTSGTLLQSSGLEVADEASNVIQVTATNPAGDTIHFAANPGVNDTGFLFGKTASTAPAALGAYTAFFKGPTGGAYNHAAGFEAGESSAEIIHLYNVNRAHLLRFNTDGSEELEINGTTAAGTTQWYMNLGADPFMVFGGADTDRVGTNDATFVGSVEVTASLTVGEEAVLPAPRVGGVDDILLFAVACSDETTDLTTGQKFAVDMPFACVLERIYVSVTTAASGADLQVDVEDEGTSLLNAVFAFQTNNAETSTFASAASVKPNRSMVCASGGDTATPNLNNQDT